MKTIERESMPKNPKFKKLTTEMLGMIAEIGFVDSGPERGLICNIENPAILQAGKLVRFDGAWQIRKLGRYYK